MNVKFSSASRAAYEFVEGVKRHIARKQMPQIITKYEKESKREELLVTLDHVENILGKMPLYKLNRSLQRISQELMWEIVLQSLEPQRSELIEELNSPVKDSKGSLKLNPEIKYPDYYASTEFHLQPGNYHNDELSGLVYDLAVPIYVMRRNGADSGYSGRALISSIPPKNYMKILDMGCGIGQKTIPVSDAYPDAEIHAIDIAAPMLKYAYRRTEHMGRKIHFSQQNVERTDFADNTFDLIVSTILLHELPPKAIHNTIFESYRILKPGGLVAHLDFPPYSSMHPFMSYLLDWDCHNNGEPYLIEYRELNLITIYKEAGFKVVREIAAKSNISKGADSLLTKFPYWITAGTK